MIWILLSIMAGIGAIALSVARSKHNSNIRAKAEQQGISAEKLPGVLKNNPFPVPGGVSTVLVLATFAFMGLGLFNKVFFYAEPGYIYHVRTILGEEKAVDDVGYNVYLFGRVNAWKKAITVQASDITLDEESVNAENESADTSVNLTAQNLVFLDQVDALVQATARYRLPTDEESFLSLAREYRSPENLLRTSLIPAFRETLQANASLMTAEEYFTGGRTSFNRDFEDQMENGIFIVRRIESVQETSEEAGADASANASLGQSQQSFDDENQVILIVEKQLADDGTFLRKPQAFTDWGISVIEARVTDVNPNEAFDRRMEQRQQASADRSIARERRIQEEEERLLAIARGDREVAERQAAARVEQIELTTNAETQRQLAVTEANLRRDQAEIDRETSEIQLERARIDAQAVQVAADAEAYQREVILNADNALQQKLDAWVEINQAYAQAFATRTVPTTTFGGGDGGGAGYAQGSDVKAFLDIMTVNAARQLDLDPSVSRE